MVINHFKIAVGPSVSVSAAISAPDGSSADIAVIVAHGAGTNMDHPLLVAFCERLTLAGIATVRFNFPYMEKRRKMPDRPDILMKTWSRVRDYVENETGGSLKKIFTAGKSMGGRIASLMLADGRLLSDGMIFLGYPLHPAGKKDQLRDEHLFRISAPMLFFAGTRDPLCDLDLLQSVLKRIRPEPRLVIIDGGDHSFHVPASSPETLSDIYDRIATESIKWMKGKKV